ncbi:unnamed protein product, partial [Amoebophrya sp. A25]
WIWTPRFLRKTFLSQRGTYLSKLVVPPIRIRLLRRFLEVPRRTLKQQEQHHREDLNPHRRMLQLRLPRHSYE